MFKKVALRGKSHFNKHKKNTLLLYVSFHCFENYGKRKLSLARSCPFLKAAIRKTCSRRLLCEEKAISTSIKNILLLYVSFHCFENHGKRNYLANT